MKEIYKKMKKLLIEREENKKKRDGLLKHSMEILKDKKKKKVQENHEMDVNKHNFFF